MRWNCLLRQLTEASRDVSKQEIILSMCLAAAKSRCRRPRSELVTAGSSMNRLRRDFHCQRRKSPQGSHLVTAVGIADFLRREFPQTRCVVEAVGDGTSTVSHEITVQELRPDDTVAGPVLTACRRRLQLDRAAPGEDDHSRSPVRTLRAVASSATRETVPLRNGWHLPAFAAALGARPTQLSESRSHDLPSSPAPGGSMSAKRCKPAAKGLQASQCKC